MSYYSGYMGRLVLLDLGKMTLEDYPWTDKERELYIGGKAMAAKIFYDNFSGGEQALSEENLIVIATGPMTGTGAPCSDGFTLAAISPRTGMPAYSQRRGGFGLWLKKAGFDALIIRGKSKAPIWIEIDRNEIDFHSAAALMNTGVEDTLRLVGSALGRRSGYMETPGILAIGAACEGEGESAIACGESLSEDYGLAEVFADKNIRAISLYGGEEPQNFNRRKAAIRYEKWSSLIKQREAEGAAAPADKADDIDTDSKAPSEIAESPSCPSVDVCLLRQYFTEAVSLLGLCPPPESLSFPRPFARRLGAWLKKKLAPALFWLGLLLRPLCLWPELVFFRLHAFPYTYAMEHGMGMNLSQGEFLKNGQRSLAIERAVKGKFGLNAEKDSLPPELSAFLSATAAGEEKGNKLYRAYYRAAGYGKTGVPGKRMLKKLEIASKQTPSETSENAGASNSPADSENV